MPPAKKTQTPKMVCLCCGSTGNTNFYRSTNKRHKHFRKLPFCKDCISEIFESLYRRFENNEKCILELCKYLDIPFKRTAFDGAKKRLEENTVGEIWRGYITIINSLGTKHKYGGSFNDSDENILDVERGLVDVVDLEREKEVKEPTRITGQDKKNKDSIVKRIASEPFSHESVRDQIYLYNTLNDIVDDSILQDGFRLTSVIGIVENLGKAKRVDRMMTEVLNCGDMTSVKELTNLISAKKSLLDSVNAAAKDSGISQIHSNSKSKGAGTLSGMIKDMQEKNIAESSVNVYDVKTSESMLQTAKMSSAAIFEQLKFDENDYTDIIAQQRRKIEADNAELLQLKEELRLLKIESKGIDIGVLSIPNENEEVVLDGNRNSIK